MENDKEQRIIRKLEFYRLLAADTGFSISDIVVLWKAFENFVFNALVDDNMLFFGGFCRIYIKHQEPYTAYDGLNNRMYQRDETERYVFKFSDAFKDALRQKRKEFIDIDWNEIMELAEEDETFEDDD